MRHQMTMLLLVAATLVSLPLTAQVKELEKYSNMKKVDYVYISKAMIDIAMNRGIAIAGMEFSKTDLMGKITAVQIIDIEDEKTRKTAKTDVEKMLSAGKYETLMATKDEDGEIIKLLYKAKGKQMTVIQITEDDEFGEYNITAFSGTYTLDDIKSLVSE